MSPDLKEKIKQYRKDGRNLFSHTEKIIAAACNDDLYQDLMPDIYKANPFHAYFNVLDDDQREVVMTYHQNF